jgi:hypothetical protein
MRTFITSGVLVSTKNDLREQGRMEVSSQEGEAFAQRNGLTFFETYAVSPSCCVASFHATSLFLSY